MLLPLIDVFKNHLVNGDYPAGDPIGGKITNLLNAQHNDAVGNTLAWDLYRAWSGNSQAGAGCSVINQSCNRL